MAQTTNRPAKEFSWDEIVRNVDPNYEFRRRNETEYEFSKGRKFTANRDTRFPYDTPAPSPGSPSLDFSDPDNSQYVPLITGGL